MSGTTGGSNAERLARAEVNDRVLPPSQHPLDPFDPLTVSDAFLERAGLPSRPDPATSPDLFDLWRRMFTPMPRFLPWSKEGFDYAEGALQIPPGEPGASHSAAIGAGGSHWGTSRNWSGGVIAARDGMIFSRIAAAWEVPEAQQPQDTAPQPPPGNRYQTSVWIGIDGYRQASLSLPQVGTVSAWNPATNRAEYYLFIQWWVRGKFYGEVKIPTFPVAKNNQIIAMLEVMASGNVRFVVVNPSQASAISVDWKAGTYWGAIWGVPIWNWPLIVPRSQVVGALAPVDGWHAVWCVERPSTMPPDPEAPDAWKHVNFYRLPRFAEATFQVALAEMRHLNRPGVPRVQRDLTAARALRMTGVAEDAGPSRTTMLAGPPAPSGGGVRLRVLQR
jgi:hypothetical protein